MDETGDAEVETDSVSHISDDKAYVDSKETKAPQVAQGTRIRKATCEPEDKTGIR